MSEKIRDDPVKNAKSFHRLGGRQIRAYRQNILLAISVLNDVSYRRSHYSGVTGTAVEGTGRCKRVPFGTASPLGVVTKWCFGAASSAISSAADLRRTGRSSHPEGTSPGP